MDVKPGSVGSDPLRIAGTEFARSGLVWELDSLVLAEVSGADPVRIAGDPGDGSQMLLEMAAPIAGTESSLMARLLQGLGRGIAFGEWGRLRAFDRLLLLAIAKVTVPMDSTNRLARSTRHLLAHVDASRPNVAALIALAIGGMALLPPIPEEPTRTEPAQLAFATPSILALQIEALRRSDTLRRVRATKKRRKLTLFELLWLVRDRTGTTFSPQSAPSVGLPVRLALRIFASAVVAAESDIAAANPFVPSAQGIAPSIWVLTKNPGKLMSARLDSIWIDANASPRGMTTMKVGISGDHIDWPMRPILHLILWLRAVDAGGNWLILHGR